jgi:CheY-like chemotaxis protein
MTEPNSITILLVDDSENDVLLMRRAFQGASASNSVQLARNGEEAVDYLKGEGRYGDRQLYPVPAVVLLDLKMPRKDGFEVLSWVRQQPVLKRLPIFILTASCRPEDIERAFDLGANAYLVKPSTLEGLVEMVKCLNSWLNLNHFAPLP